MRVIIIAALLAFTLVAVSGCSSSSPEPNKSIQFSAILTMSDASGQVDSHVSFMPEMQRVDALPAGNGMVIIRRDKGVVWTMMPDKMVYLETEVRPNYKNPLMTMPEKVINSKVVGKEKISGHPTIKEEMEIETAGVGPMKIYRWMATDIKWPIKAAAVDGSWTLEYKKIVVAPQDAKHFEIPAGYRRMVK